MGAELGWLTRITGRLRPRWRVAASVSRADEVPDRIPTRSAILVGTPESPKWIAFDCPCRRSHRVLLNLNPARDPRWSVRETSPLTIWPSIDDHSLPTGCHYFIHSGRIVWAPAVRRLRPCIMASWSRRRG